MKELYNKTNKYLSITSVCLDTHEAVYISHETFPDIPVWKAILMSCSIPLIFKPIEWENKLYIDGGLVDNFPLFNIKLDDIKNTLGIQINLNYKRKNDSILIEESNIYNYVINLIQIIMESKTEIKPYNIISIKIDNLILNNSLSIDINKDIKIKLINIGYEETKIQFPKLFNKKTSNIGTQTTNFRNRSNSI
jgi:NTE family protein